MIFCGFVGAYFPECNSHVLEWAKFSRMFKKEYIIPDIIFTSTNDHHVLLDYAKRLNFEDRVSFLADPHGKLATFMDATEEMDGLGLRSTRYAAPVFYNRLKAVYQSAHQQIYYTRAVSPQFFVELFKNKKARVRIFL